MGQVTVTLNGRTYRLRCGDGEEPRLLELAEYVRQRIDALAAEFGQVGDERLLLMALLLITDELWDARAGVAPPPPAVPEASLAANGKPPLPAPVTPPGADLADRKLLRRAMARGVADGSTSD